MFCVLACLRKGGEGGTNNPTPPRTPTMSGFKIPTGPSIAENKLTYRVHKWKVRHAEAKHGSITHDCEKGGMTHEWADADAFAAWLVTKEANKAIELILSKVERLDSTIWQERCMYRCARESTSGKKNRQKTIKSERAIPSKKTGCRCRLTIKMYSHTNKILGKYDEEHDHAIGDENLRFTKLLGTTKDLVMELARAGVHTKAIVRGNYFAYFSADGDLAKARARKNRDYHITTSDIVRFHQVVENQSMRHDDNDAISIRVWILHIQEDSGSAMLKDKLDPAPPRLGLSSEIFVLCVQTKFQVEQFQKLGSDFFSIDVTHNTTEYSGLNLFTIIVRDWWGHGTLCGVFPYLNTYSISAPQGFLPRGW